MLREQKEMERKEYDAIMQKAKDATALLPLDKILAILEGFYLRMHGACHTDPIKMKQRPLEFLEFLNSPFQDD